MASTRARIQPAVRVQQALPGREQSLRLISFSTMQQTRWSQKESVTRNFNYASQRTINLQFSPITLFLLDKTGTNFELLGRHDTLFPVFMKHNFKRFNIDYSITPHSNILVSWTLNFAVTAIQVTAYSTGTEMLTHINTLTS